MNKKFILIISIVLIIFLSVISCKNELFVKEKPVFIGEEKPVIDSNNKFAFKLFEKLSTEDRGKNISVSPFSISLVLSMLYNGSDGEVKAEIEEVMNFKKLELDKINQAQEKIINYLEYPGEKIEIHIANSIWFKEDIKVKSDFIKINKKYYDSEVNEGINLTDINKWVKKNTAGKIDKILSKIEPATLVILLNAIYFKGEWEEKFDPENTYNDIFYLSGIKEDKIEKEVPMMSQFGEFFYFENENFQAINLPYKDKKMSMYIFLPVNGSSLEEFQKELSQENMEKWLNSFYYGEGFISLPLFTIEYEKELNEILKKLGMKNAFEVSNDFDKIVYIDVGIFIEKIVHKTFLKVNEEGTEAAAVTITETDEGAISEQFDMKVNRPFFFIIRDNETGIILFMGSIVDPS